MTPTNAELIFWAVACALALIFIFIVMPTVSNYLDHKDVKRMFSHYERTEYHDDMEDVYR